METGHFPLFKYHPPIPLPLIKLFVVGDQARRGEGTGPPSLGKAKKEGLAGGDPALGSPEL